MSVMDIISARILKPSREDRAITNYKYVKPEGQHSADYCEKLVAVAAQS